MSLDHVLAVRIFYVQYKFPFLINLMTLTLILISLFLPSHSVTLPYFILAVAMRECLGKHSYMSSSFHIVLLNDTTFFPTVLLQVHNENLSRCGRNTDALD